MRYAPAQIFKSERISQAKLRDSQFNSLNNQSFKDMVKYITALKNDHIIDDEV